MCYETAETSVQSPPPRLLANKSPIQTLCLAQKRQFNLNYCPLYGAVVLWQVDRGSRQSPAVSGDRRSHGPTHAPAAHVAAMAGRNVVWVGLLPMQ